MRKIFVRWVFYLLTLTFILGYQTPLEAKKSPNFWIRNLEGDRFDSRRHKGAYVISFFFVNCVPCIKEIPELHSLVTKEFPNTKLLFIDPVDEDSEDDIRDFANKLEIPHEFFYRDSFGSVSKKFFRGKFAFPTIVGVAKKKLIFRHSGIDEKIKEDIQKKLMNQG